MYELKGGLQMRVEARGAEECALPLQPFLTCLRNARRGTAAGPSGVTNEHLRILLDEEADWTFLHGAAQRLARADVPAPVLPAIRAGRIVALRKPNGRVRALVVGDVLRRLVGRTLAQQYASELQAACMPIQYGLSTRAGTEALVRLLRVATEMDPRATVLSIDAVGAFDHVSRHAMLAGLMHRPSLQPLLPFARQFYASDSTYVWQDAQGDTHEIRQAEGGEQGDPLMPALYAIAQHPALAAVNEQLHEGEAVFAYLDDIYVVAAPERIRELQDLCQRALREHTRIELNRGKTRIWNAGGEEPANISDLHGQSEEPIWTGDWALPRDRQGLLVLGTPLGTDEYVASTLAARSETQQRLLTRIPDVPDLQAAWLLLHFCAAPRANYLLRNVPPALTAQFAADHDAAVATCLGSLVHCGDHMPAAATQASHAAGPRLRRTGVALCSC